MTPIPTIPPITARPQKLALMWCNADGSPRDYEKGPREVSFFVMSKVVKGDPERQMAIIYSLVKRSENRARKSGLWPMTTWALTPLGLAVRAVLQEQSK